MAIRITTLRRLAQADPNNPVWAEDQRVFEQERLRQIQREVTDAAAAMDMERVSALDRELQNASWIELPPGALIRWVAELHDGGLQKQTRASLAQLADQLNEAFSAVDEERARQYRQSWNRLTQASPLALGDDLYERAAPALKWLDEEDERRRHSEEHEAAVAALEQALDRDTSAQRLERMYHAALRHGYELSEQLDLRYQRRMRGLESSAARRRYLIIAASAAGILLLSTAVAYGVWHWRVASQIATSTVSLEKLIQEEKLLDAQQYFTQLQTTNAVVANSPRLTELAVRMQSATEAEERRSKAFADALQKAISLGPGSHDQSALAEAGRLVKTDPERAHLGEFNAQVTAWRDEEQRRVDGAFLNDLRSIRSQLEELEASTAESGQALLLKVNELRSECQALKAKGHGVSPAALAQIQPMWARLDTLTDRADRLKEEERLLAEIARAGSDVKRFLATMGDYTEKLHDVPRSQDFKQVITEATLWAALRQWNDLARTSAAGKTNARAASILLQKINTLLASESGFPQAEAWKARLPYLEAVAARESDGKANLAQLEKLYNDPLMTRLSMVESPAGRRFYLNNPPDIKRDKGNPIRYIAAFDLSDKPMTIQGKDIVFAGRAPQAALSKDLCDLLGELTDDNWEQTFHRLAMAVASSHKQTEPLLRFSLLRRTLEVGSQGSSVSKKHFRRPLEALTRSKVSPFVNWLDPLDKEAPEARAEAEKVLDALGLEALAADIAQDVETERRLPDQEYVWHGHLLRNADGQWKLQSSSNSLDGELFVVRRGRDPEKVVIEEIGAIEENQLSLYPRVRARI